MRLSTPFLLLALGSLLLVGCRQQGISTEVRSSGGNPQLGFEIEEQSPQLAKSVKVRQAVAQQVNGLWQAQVEVRNISTQTLALTYRFKWRDAQGGEHPSLLDAWRDVTVASGETVALQSVASSPVAARYVFTIRFRE